MRAPDALSAASRSLGVVLRNLRPSRLFSTAYARRRLNLLAATAASSVFRATGARAEFRFLPEPVVVIEGVKLAYDWTQGGNILGMDAFGPHEPNDLRLVLRLLGDRGVFYDVGANIGWYALRVALAKAGTAVVCFEPFVDALTRNLELNGLRDVRVLAFALSDRSGTTHMTSDHKSMNHVLARDRRGTPVRLAKLDDLVETEALPPPDVLKIDIEGYEYFALRGAGATLRRARPAVLCEVNGLHRRYDVSESMMLDLFEELRYRPCAVGEDFRPRPIERGGVTGAASVCENLLFLPCEALP